jgi:hypothetical protein
VVTPAVVGEREKEEGKGGWSFAILRRGEAAASPILGRCGVVWRGPWMTSAMTAAVGLSWSGGKAAARGVGGARADGGGVRPVGHLASERARDAGVRPDFERRRREIGTEEREIKREREKHREREEEDERARETERASDGSLSARMRATHVRGGKMMGWEGRWAGGGKSVHPKIQGGKVDFYREN